MREFSIVAAVELLPVPAMTCALVVVSSFAGEQQRATEVKKGFLQKITP